VRRVARKGDTVFCANECHLTPFGPDTHPVIGSIEQGSGNCFVNDQPIARKSDGGHHKICTGTNTFLITDTCSPKYFVNNLPVARDGDATTHCGCDLPGTGQGNILSSCSPDHFCD
jgi:uncharacterized Zn-binding protein involved in type VI secretion